jgi:hypothetical protein
MSSHTSPTGVFQSPPFKVAYKDIAESYPSLNYLESLSNALRNVTYTDVDSKNIYRTGRWTQLGQRMHRLKPFLDDWFGTRDHWYGHDITTAITNLRIAKLQAIQEIGKTEEGCSFLQSEELQHCHHMIETALDAALA